MRIVLRAVAVVVAILTVLTTIVAWNWPFTQAKTEKTLAGRSGRPVKIGGFRATYFPPGFIATDVRFLRHDHPDKEPMIEAKKMELAARWADLWSFRKRARSLDVYDLHLLVPPRGAGADGKEHDLLPQGAGKKNGNSLTIDTVTFHGADIEFLPGAGGTEPMRIRVKGLRLTRVGDGMPFSFEALVENPLPHGEVHEKGTFGPWNEDQPSRTPLEGAYEFHKGRMSDIPGISGEIETNGTFKGTLDRIDVEGHATIPDFEVVRSKHRESLTTEYRASVNATNGDVQLHQVDTRFGNTTIRAKGTVAGEPNRKGKVATLEASVDNGRVEELERMFTQSAKAPLSGAITLQTSIRLPPGAEPFLRRLDMNGHFETTGDQFANPKTQAMLGKLAESARGKSRNEQDVMAPAVRSQVKSAIVVKGGVAQIRRCYLTAPGTEVLMDGHFDLISKELNLKGTMKTDGKLSDTQNGAKEFAAKLLTPFLKKEHATIVPFQITGVMGDLHTKLDLGAKRKL